MTLPVYFSAEAITELDDAATWYDDKRVGLGGEFIDAVEEAVEAITGWPRSGSLVDGVQADLEVRRLPVPMHSACELVSTVPFVDDRGEDMRGGRSYRWIPVLLMVVVASCGDDDAQPSNTTESESPATTSASEASRAEDLAIAESAVLTLDDFPPGWEEGPVEPPSDDPEIEAAIAECLDVPVDELYPDNPEATSPTFTSPQDEEVSSSVTVTPSPEDAQRSLERMSGDAVPGCYAQAVQALITHSLLSSDDVPEGLDFGEVTFNRMSTERIGDESIAFRVTLPFEYQGFGSQFELDLVLARVGRVGITMSFESEGTSFDPEEARQLTEAVVDRVEAADAG